MIDVLAVLVLAGPVAVVAVVPAPVVSAAAGPASAGLVVVVPALLVAVAELAPVAAGLVVVVTRALLVRLVPHTYLLSFVEFFLKKYPDCAGLLYHVTIQLVPSETSSIFSAGLNFHVSRPSIVSVELACIVNEFVDAIISVLTILYCFPVLLAAAGRLMVELPPEASYRITESSLLAV